MADSKNKPHGPRFVDLIGQTFSRLTVQSYAGQRNKLSLWLCLCVCGKTVTVSTASLRAGNTRSCGCLLSEWTTANNKKKATHRKTGTRIYEKWRSMHRRCYDPQVNGYSCYGGRGITVCQRWENFQNFYADMGDPPHGMTLDRIDNDGNYEPANCRWADAKTQARNRRDNSIRSTNRMVTYLGKTQSVTMWAKEIGIKRATLFRRLRVGNSLQVAMSPTHQRKGCQLKPIV